MEADLASLHYDIDKGLQQLLAIGEQVVYALINKGGGFFLLSVLIALMSEESYLNGLAEQLLA